MDKAKRADKIATAVLYIVSGLIVAILAFLLLYILIRGLPHVSWEFLTSPSKAYQKAAESEFNYSIRSICC